VAHHDPLPFPGLQAMTALDRSYTHTIRPGQILIMPVILDTHA